MGKKNRVTSMFLRALADAVDELSEKELERLLNSSGIGTLIKTGSRKPQAVREEDYSLVHQVHDVMFNLSQTSSREEALRYLTQLRPSRRLLVMLANNRDVHVVKQDTIGILIEKIVANVVGSRLDSDAIRNGDR